MKNISAGKKQRDSLALQLKKARRKLQILKKELRCLEILASHQYKTLVTDKVLGRQFGKIPTEPLYKPNDRGEGLPKLPGVYFIWSHGSVVYVGQSISLNSRLRLGKHDALFEGDLISFLVMEKEELGFAESYYIGTIKPVRNFGGWRTITRPKCPTCDSRAPHLHPAVQPEGEIEICIDDFHLQITPQNLEDYRNGVLAKRKQISSP